MSDELKPYESGMLREDKSSKVDYTLTLDGPMFRRWARHLTSGAARHGPRNWTLATGEKELTDFKAGALRHFIQWYYGETDEDHPAAIFFNVNGAEYVKDKIKEATAMAERAAMLIKHVKYMATVVNRDI